MNSLRKRTNERGSMIVEYLVVLPLFFILIWAILQAMIYIMCHSTLSESAIESARVLSLELRGKEGGLPDGDDVSPTGGLAQEVIKGKMTEKLKSITEFNKYLLLFYDNNGNLSSPAILLLSTMDGTEASQCQQFLATKPRAICAYVKSRLIEDRNQEQVVVRVKCEFKLIGSFIPGLNTLQVEGIGTSTKELTNRYQYYEAPTHNYGG